MKTRLNYALLFILLILLSLVTSGFSLSAKDSKAKTKPSVTIPEPTFKNMKYGPHERNVLDFWKADTPNAPLLFIIHGGGWLANDKDRYVATRHKKDIEWFLKHGVSVAAINYRYSSQAPLPAPVYDAARALQFIRSKSKEFGIDKDRIAATGSSAGGCTTVWLATHNDIADPKSDDPVLRESSRINAAVAFVAQTTVDPKMIKEWFGDIPVTHAMIHTCAGFKTRAEMEKDYEKAKDIYYDFSAVNHLDKNDPPILLSYGGNLTDKTNGIHHPIFGAKFKEKADKVGATCIFNLYNKTNKSPLKDWKEFVLKELKVKEK